MKSNSGFTIIELVIVITITGILTVVIVPLLSRPFSIFQDMQIRASLVDRAQMALATMSREIRQSVPNSVRVSGNALELMPVTFAGRYVVSDNVANIDTLTARQADAGFSIMGKIPSLTGQRLIVNPTSTVLLYAATANSINRMVTPSTTTITVTSNGVQDRISLNPAFRFDPAGNGSPARRIFASSGPVSFVCAAGKLSRYERYLPAVAQPTNPLVAPLNAAVPSLITDSVSSCQFRYSAGTSQRSALLTLELTVTTNGESIHLIEQVHVENAP